MSEENSGQNVDFTVNVNNLYREENITDLKVASIRKLIPVKPDGSLDESRAPLFYGHSQLVSPQGPVPLQAQLPANNLQEALEVFPAAMKKDLEDMLKRIQDMQKQEEKQKEEKKE